MKGEAHEAIIYFSARETWLPGRWPSRRQAIGRIIELYTGCRLIHCAIAFDGAVLDPGLLGDRLYPEAGYALLERRWVLRLTVPVPGRIDLDHGIDTRPRPVWPTFWRWATLGLFQTRDCVSVVARHLRAGGIDVPAWLVRPADLAMWLIRNANAQASFRPAP